MFAVESFSSIRDSLVWSFGAICSTEVHANKQENKPNYKKTSEQTRKQAENKHKQTKEQAVNNQKRKKNEINTQTNISKQVYIRVSKKHTRQTTDERGKRLHV